ncbi:transcriptional regulator GcvA [Alloalcanivorax mobilis]|uniref:transcriptional regulator GcvA n=1 Tax=Alloalcanivorax mobilis TaxID=2019569 RepID=UPI000C76591F|nr:transcriptional regulator GcvA [Alloalcanivorax mobilis]
MSRTVPPLNPLRVFECAARHGSFTKAADELFVSQSAVSRQIATLEDYLSVKLFVREQGGVRLTPEGERYQREIGPAFASIASATDRLRRTTAASPLKLRVYATFAAKWLIRRLNDFHARNPGIHVRISTSVAPVTFAKDDVDGAIQFGDGNWVDGDAEFLFGDQIEPVCSPSLLAAGPALSNPQDLFQHRLLHSRYRRIDWQDWLSSVGLRLPDETEPMIFPSSLLTYQAAMDGLGVAIGQVRMLQSEFKTGTLIRPFQRPLERDLAHYFVLPKGVEPSSKLRIFRDWLRQEIENEELL